MSSSRTGAPTLCASSVKKPIWSRTGFELTEQTLLPLAIPAFASMLPGVTFSIVRSAPTCMPSACGLIGTTT